MNKQNFEYRYSAPTIEERKEIESIRQSYLDKTPENEKLSKLKSLDKKVKTLPNIISISFGVFFTLVFGLGLTMILEWKIIVWGIVVSVAGIIPLFFTHLLHKKIKTFLKNKYSKIIIKLSEELLNNEDK